MSRGGIPSCAMGMKSKDALPGELDRLENIGSASGRMNGSSPKDMPKDRYALIELAFCMVQVSTLKKNL